MLEGGTVRNAYAGISNRMALMAIDLVETGFIGERDGLSSVFGKVVSERFDTARMIDGLGRDWQIDQNYFKLHSCCRYNHGALDALDLLLAREAVAAEAVERVDVASYLYAAELDDQAPRNTLGAKFSVPFAVATRLVRGSSRVENFTWDALRDERVQALAKRVFVVADKAMTAKLPQFRPARVDVRLRDGRTLTSDVEANRGDDQDPTRATTHRQILLADGTDAAARRGRRYPAEDPAAGWHRRPTHCLRTLTMRLRPRPSPTTRPTGNCSRPASR